MIWYALYKYILYCEQFFFLFSFFPFAFVSGKDVPIDVIEKSALYVHIEINNRFVVVRPTSYRCTREVAAR